MKEPIMDSIECRNFQNDLDRLIGGELAGELRPALMAHLSGCADCREHHALLEEISSRSIPEPDERELLAMRRSVLGRIRDEERRDSRWFGLSQAAAIALLVSGAALFLAAGWFAGRGAAGSSLLVAGGARGGNPDVILARQMQREARANNVVEDVENSPFRYANVRIEQAGNDRVRLSFDVSRHLELTLPKDDPLVTEVLVQSMLEAGSVGSKLEAIGQAGNVLDPKIRGALIKAMLHDPNLGVRLQAQARLVEGAADPALADAFVAVLEREESVQMRLVAIDHLTRSRIDPGRLEKAVEAGEPAGRGAVRVRADDYLRSF
jgi:hypothetical protein